MNEFFNREDQTSKRRELRGSMPNAEVILWSRLKGRQLLGCKFRRQYSVGTFVIDFFAVEIKLGIELDGDSHFQPGALEYDRKREQFIESFGIRIVRVLNSDVHDNLDGVLEMIGREVDRRRGENVSGGAGGTRSRGVGKRGPIGAGGAASTPPGPPFTRGGSVGEIGAGGAGASLQAERGAIGTGGAAPPRPPLHGVKGWERSGTGGAAVPPFARGEAEAGSDRNW